MLGNRGASLTTESSAAFPSAEDASPDSRILNRNTAEAQPLNPFRRKCLFLEPALSEKPNKSGCSNSPRSGLRAFFGEYLLVFRRRAISLRVPLDPPFWFQFRKEYEHGCGFPR